MLAILDKIKFNENGLIPAVLQDIKTKEVLMLAYMNKDSLEKTIETGKACFWSRSRQELWLKGETSGNYQEVEEIRLDCDNDTLLLLVKPAGPACHTNKQSCFFTKIEGDKIVEFAEDTEDDSAQASAVNDEKLYKEKSIFLYKLYQLIDGRKENPVEGSYTNYLFDKGVDKICKKIGEEAAEVIIGAKNASKDEMIYEIGDLFYHLFVLMSLYEISPTAILKELESRSK